MDGTERKFGVALDESLGERRGWSLWTTYKDYSFFSRALLAAIPNGFLAIALVLLVNPREANQAASAVGVAQIWTGYNFVLGFLIVFRTTHSYARFWEGAALLHQIRGEWFNAVSSLFAFCSPRPEKRAEVEHFQNLVVRLASMLHCAALQQISVREIKDFQTIELDGIDPEALHFLKGKDDKCEVLLQWMQRLIIDASHSSVLPVAPPILSRVFQELSRGIVNFNSAKKITEVPFPHPYTLMIKIMLGIQWIITPLVAATVMDSWPFAGGLSMITVFAFWSTVHIAAEIENPYGDDAYDLPLVEYQICFNESLLTLLDERAQIPPCYKYAKKDGQHLGSLELTSSYNDWIVDGRGSKVSLSSRRSSRGRRHMASRGSKSSVRSGAGCQAATGSVIAEPVALRSLGKEPSDGSLQGGAASQGGHVSCSRLADGLKPNGTGVAMASPTASPTASPASLSRREIPPLSLEGVNRGGRNAEVSVKRTLKEVPQHRVILLEEQPPDEGFGSERCGKGYFPCSGESNDSSGGSTQRIAEIQAETTGLGGADGSMSNSRDADGCSHRRAVLL